MFNPRGLIEGPFVPTAVRICLLLLIVAAPWPFASATPVPSSWLTALSLTLFATWLVARIWTPGPSPPLPAAGWLAAGLILVALQLAPLPEGIHRWVAPGSYRIHYPEVPAAASVLSDASHPVSVEPFATEIELWRLAALGAVFLLSSQVFTTRRDTTLLVSTVTLLGVTLSLFAVYQQAKWGNLLYGRFPVPSGSPFGPFVNHNHFAGFVAMAALVSLGAAFGFLRRSPQVAMLFFGASGLVAIGLALSHSRGGLPVPCAPGTLDVVETPSTRRIRMRLTHRVVPSVG